MRVLNRIFYSFVPSTRIKKHFMFQLYLLLRLKNFGRIVIELGIFRIVFLTILTVAAIMILFLAENRFVIPVVCVLLLASYHNYRKDKEFLHTLTSHLPVFLLWKKARVGHISRKIGGTSVYIHNFLCREKVSG